MQLLDVMLSNKFYAGILVDPWTGAEYAGQHQPMITIEEYHQLQAVRASLSNNAVGKRAAINPNFPLRGTILCAGCNAVLTSGKTKGRSQYYPYYHCKTKECRHYDRTITKDELEEKFVDFLQKITPTDECLRYFEHVVLDVWQDRHTTYKQECENYERQLKTLETRKDRLIEMRFNGEITKEKFEELNERIEIEKTAFTISRNEANIEELDMEAAVSYTTNFIRNLARQWQDMQDVNQKQRLQKLVLPSGIVYDKTAGTFGTAELSCIFKLFDF